MIASTLLRDLVSVEHLRGTGSSGKPSYAVPVPVWVNADVSARLMMGKDGPTWIRTGTLIARPDAGFTVGDRVTYTGHAYTVQQVSPQRVGYSVQHLEVTLG